jgi:hypothetical protein
MKIENSYLKEFYQILFYYLYEGDENFSNYSNFIKRKLKIYIYEKAEKFCNYYSDKTRVDKQIEEYEKENHLIDKSKNYNNMMCEYMNNMAAKREQLINKALNIIDKKLKK